MRHGKDFENKPIISLTDGRMLGRVKDVYVDDQLQQLAGLYLGSEGMIRRRAQVIQSQDVVLFGIDVVLAKNSDVITKDKELPDSINWRRLKDIQGYEVHTSGGTKLGIVGDIILDETGAIIGLSLSRVFVKGPLAEQSTVPREVVLESAHKEEIIRVDLAMLEGLAAGVDEKTPVTETSDEVLVEEINIDEVESDDKSVALDVEELPEPEVSETGSSIDDALDAASDEQE